MSAREKSAFPAQQEGSPSPPRRSIVVYDILRTAGALRRLYADIFEQYGITFQQYNVVRILRGAGPGGLPTLEIVSRMIDQAPGITRLLDRLESKKLKPTQERVRAAVRSLSDAEVANLLDYLERIRETRLGPTALK